MRVCFLTFLSIVFSGTSVFADSPGPTEATAEFESLSPSDLVLEIERVEDFFGWFELREAVLRRKLDDPKLKNALKETEDRLRKLFPPKQIHEHLELLAFRWRIHSLRDDGLARYRANWLLHLTEKTELEKGESLRLILEARPKPDQAHLLLYETERENGVMQGPIRLDPPLPEWAPDSYHLLMIPFAGPIIPFQMKTYFLRKKEEQILGRWGTTLDLGWYVDLPE